MNGAFWIAHFEWHIVDGTFWMAHFEQCKCAQIPSSISNSYRKGSAAEKFRVEALPRYMIVSKTRRSILKQYRTIQKRHRNDTGTTSGRHRDDTGTTSGRHRAAASPRRQTATGGSAFRKEIRRAFACICARFLISGCFRCSGKPEAVAFLRQTRYNGIGCGLLQHGFCKTQRRRQAARTAYSDPIPTGFRLVFAVLQTGFRLVFAVFPTGFRPACGIL